MIAIITGGSSGIGAAAARALRERGATVAITGRSAETARLAAELGCDHYLCDFARFGDVRALAGQLLAKYPRIDVLANNVGCVIGVRQVTEDGHEKTLQVNHLSPFLLTTLLRERLEASGATIINTSSGAHRMGHVDFADLENERRYSAWRAYGNAKLMNILHAAEINVRYRGVRAASFHPGVVATGFAREGSPLTRILYDVFGRIFMLSSEKGADTLVWLATTTDWPVGEFFIKRKVAKKSTEAADRILAGKLWDVSMTAVSDGSVR
jgi:NAD(P)-dependent dehydrogenase (short-subunit alcohol dehydrogenase family)